jgi:hypothetical protein
MCVFGLIMVNCSNSKSDDSNNALQQAGEDISNCETAANSKNVLTSRDIDSCVNGLFTLGYDCDAPPSLTIIEIETGQWALRQGKMPLKLSKNYTFDDLMELCK